MREGRNRITDGSYRFKGSHPLPSDHTCGEEMDDNKTNPGVGAGFMADILKDLQKQYGVPVSPD